MVDGSGSEGSRWWYSAVLVMAVVVFAEIDGGGARWWCSVVVVICGACGS